MADFTETRQRMEKSLLALREEIAAIRTGRASPAIIENIVCPVYQGTQKLRVMELGSISSSDPQTLVIQPWDGTIIGEIKQGILAANIGLTPVIDGSLIRLSVPPLTSERRQEFIKLLRQRSEENRVAMRNIRRDKMVDIKDDFDRKLMGEDEKFKLEQELQKITDEYIGKVNDIEKRKEMELLQV